MLVETIQFASDEFSAQDVTAEEQSCDETDVLDKSAVAEFSESDINNMSCHELVRVIRAASLTDAMQSDFDRRLPFYDRPTLKRLAFLARRCCRNQGF